MRSDFAVFHRIDDPTELDGPTFFARASRLVHYRGAIRDMAMLELQKQEQRDTPAPVQPSYQQQSRENVSESQLAVQLGAEPGWLNRE